MFINKKIAIVTGANTGIGKTIASKLANEEIFVIGTSTSNFGVKKINERLSNKGKGILLNITNFKHVTQTIKNIYKEFNAINILVNNAGIKKDNFLLLMPKKNWWDVLNTNLNSIFCISKNVVKVMVKQKQGRIITIGSVVGNIGNQGQTNYAATKAGIIGFNKSLALEVATKGITVNTIAPGFIKTNMTSTLTKIKKKYLEKIPMNRFGSPEDIAHAVLFLVSDQASYITGETLHINGGLYMK